MMRSVLRRCAAMGILLAFCTLIGACAFAEDAPEKINCVRIAPPASVSESVRLTGPDVDEDGSVLLQEGKTVHFTLEGPLTTDLSELNSYEAQGGRQNALFFNLMVSRVFDGIQGNTSYGDMMLLHADETGALFGRTADGEAGSLRMEFEDAQITSVDRIEDTGELYFSMLGTCQIEVRFPVSRTVQRPAFDGSEAYQSETESLLSSAAVLPEPFDELVFRATVNGQMGAGRITSFSAEEFAFSFSTITGYAENQWDAELEYGGQVQKVDVGEDLPWGYQTVALLNITDWGYVATGGGAVVATATGATALGLGGSAVANALAQPDALPVRRRDEEFPTEEPDEAPDLPEEDSPEVSLSLYKPFTDLVNTKGAAVDIQVAVNGGEGLSWHYLPTAICPDGLRTVVPTVMGTGSESTLVLGLTGAPMKQAHCPVFVTVIAWAVGPDGKLLKTSGNMELTLHRGGLEATRKPDGSLEVVSYADGNLNGLAEKRVLKDSAYTLETQADGSVTVRANEKRLGSCTLPPEENG